MMTQIRTVRALASTFKNTLAGRLLQSGRLAAMATLVGVTVAADPPLAQFYRGGQTWPSFETDAQIRNVVSRCLDTYIQRSCALCFPRDADKDVCWVDNNALFDDNWDLGGRLTGRQIPSDGYTRYFAVYQVAGAIVRHNRSRYPDEWKCLVDYRSDPDERDTFRHFHDEFLYAADPGLYGIDWCYVRTSEFRRTLTLSEVLWSMLERQDDQAKHRSDPIPGFGLYSARAEGRGRAWGEGRGPTPEVARWWALYFCRRHAPDCRVVRQGYQ